MLKKIFSKKNFYILGAIFLAWFFYYICTRTPLAGDDWGYVVAGIGKNPFSLAFESYYTWSGRFFSELWDYTMTPRKELWNVINPTLFVLTYIGIIKLIGIRKKHILIPIVVITIILTIENNIRMETYSWIVGSIFIIPMCLSVWYFVIIDNLFRRSLISKRYIFYILISNTFLFIIGMMMENLSAGVLFGIIVLLIYSWFNNRKIFKYLLINLIVLSISFMICRLSPGSAYRLARDHAEWSQLNLVEKIIDAYPNFIDKTFIANKYMILLLGTSMLGLIFAKMKVLKNYISIPSAILMLLSIFNVFSSAIIKENNIFIDSNTVYSMVFWILYTIDLFIILFCSYEEGLFRDKTIFILLLSGACAIVLLLSPIYGSRSALFSVYYIAVLIGLVIDSYDINKYLVILVGIVLIALCYKKTVYYMSVYDEVAYDQKKRLVEIDYYKTHPEIEEVWIKRFEDGSIHSIDINPDDIYHLQTFKEYYGLPQKTENIIFYYENEKEN